MVLVRRAELDDAEAAAAAYQAAWNAAHAPLIGKQLEELMTPLQVVAGFGDSLGKTGPSAQILVAESGERIIGLAAVTSAGDGTGELTHLYVMPDHWGQGIGHKLQTAGLNELEAMGVTEVILWVAEANDRAQSFYNRTGWTPDGETRPSPLGPTELRYQKSI